MEIRTYDLPLRLTSELYALDMPDSQPSLRALQLLVAAAKAGSLSAGARKLGMVQPNASRLMRSLEKDLGLILFQRKTSGATLTTTGSTVVEWATLVLDAVDDLISGTTVLRRNQNKLVRVASSMTIAEYLLPEWLGVLRNVRPQLLPRIEVVNSEDVCQLILDGAADLGFIESPNLDPVFHTLVVAQDLMTLVVGRSHPWATRTEPLRLEEIAQTPLVVREPGSGTRLALEAALEPFARVEPILQFTTNPAIKVSVATGIAPAVLSQLAVDIEIRSGQLIAVPLAEDIIRQLRAIWVGEIMHPGAAELMEIARNRETRQLWN